MKEILFNLGCGLDAPSPPPQPDAAHRLQVLFQEGVQELRRKVDDGEAKNEPKELVK